MKDILVNTTEDKEKIYHEIFVDNFFSHFQSVKSVEQQNIPLFLTWLLNDVKENDESSGRKEKIIFHLSSHIHFVYANEIIPEIKRLESSVNCSELKESLMTTEPSIKYGWPHRWCLHIKWSEIEIPNLIWNLPHIEKIDFSKRYDQKKLEFLSHSIGKLTDVEEVKLYRNNLKDLPISLLCCKKLRKLKLVANNFEELPLFLKDLPNLELVERFCNPLTWMNFGSGLRIKKHEDREQLLEDVPEIVLNPELNLHQNQQPPGDNYEPKPEITKLHNQIVY